MSRLKKSIIYITYSDQNWLIGLEYFFGEFQEEYAVLQFKTVEEVLDLSLKNTINIHAIILDWELETSGFEKVEAIQKLELYFPCLPIVAFSENCHMDLISKSLIKNKITNDSTSLFKTILSYINTFNLEWTIPNFNFLFYTVRILDYYDSDPYRVYLGLFDNANFYKNRQEAINFYKENFPKHFKSDCMHLIK